jgi:hypothetical protein
MARIDNTDKKKIVDFFQRVGYEVTFLNASDESVSEELVEGYSSSWNSLVYITNYYSRKSKRRCLEYIYPSENIFLFFG